MTTSSALRRLSLWFCLLISTAGLSAAFQHSATAREDEFYPIWWNLYDKASVLCQDTIEIRFNRSYADAQPKPDTVIRFNLVTRTQSGLGETSTRLKATTRWSEDSTTVFCIPEGGFPLSAVSSSRNEVLQYFQVEVYSTGWRLFSDSPLTKSSRMSGGVGIINDFERHRLWPSTSWLVTAGALVDGQWLAAKDLPTSSLRIDHDDSIRRDEMIPFLWRVPLPDTAREGPPRFSLGFDPLYQDRPFKHWITNDPRIDKTKPFFRLPPMYCHDPAIVWLSRNIVGTEFSRSQALQYYAVYGEKAKRKRIVITTDSVATELQFAVWYGQPRLQRDTTITRIGLTVLGPWDETHEYLGDDAKNKHHILDLVEDSSEVLRYAGAETILPDSLDEKGSLVIESNVPEYRATGTYFYGGVGLTRHIVELADTPAMTGRTRPAHLYPFFEPDTLFLHFRWVYDEPQNVLENVSARMTLAPNPSNGSTVRLDLPAEVYQRKTRVTIVDIVGRTIAAYDADNATSLELDCSTFPSGTYQVHLQSGPWFGSKPLHIVR